MNLHGRGVKSKMVKCEMRESSGVLGKMPLKKQRLMGTQYVSPHFGGLVC